MQNIFYCDPNLTRGPSPRVLWDWRAVQEICTQSSLSSTPRVVILSGSKDQPPRYCTRTEVFFKDCSVFGSIHLPLNTTQFVCWNGKHCLNAMQPPPCFTVGAMFLGCWVMKGLFQDQHLIYLFILSRQTAESSLARVSRASTLSRITVISSADSWRLSDSNEVHFSSGL